MECCFICLYSLVINGAYVQVKIQIQELAEISYDKDMETLYDLGNNT